MYCPYINKCETSILNWDSTKFDENGNAVSGTQTTQTLYEFEKCAEEECAAWQDGHCIRRA